MNKENIPYTKEEILDIFRLLSINNSLTQRDLSNNLGISVGKTNYLLKSLIKNSLIEVKVSNSNGHKSKKVKYIVTKRGIEQKLYLTNHFLKKKEKEYLRLREEIERISQIELSDSKVHEAIE
jgi:EPS-associated MarR family transcriptional regulator